MYILREDYKKKTCPVCGKEFFCYTETWRYKRSPFGQSKVYLCSWTCLNEFDRIRSVQVKPSRTRGITQSADLSAIRGEKEN